MRYLLIAALLASPLAAEELVFDAGATSSCVAAQDTEPAMLMCIGRAAEACMELTEGGWTTYGMVSCIGAELSYWDAELNIAYKAAVADAKAVDAENAEYGASAPSVEDALRAMQRGWIAYRDGLCSFERSLWGGGTGGGPAGAGCLMHETARQTLVLRRGVGLE